MTTPIVKFKLVQSLKKFLIAFGLQLLDEAGQKLAGFRLEKSGLVHGLKMLDDSSEG
jgi:hypothetical protein